VSQVLNCRNAVPHVLINALRHLTALQTLYQALLNCRRPLISIAPTSKTVDYQSIRLCTGHHVSQLRHNNFWGHWIYWTTCGS
jgi:hypothetical protein